MAAMAVVGTMSPSAVMLGGLMRLPTVGVYQTSRFVRAMPISANRRSLQIRADVRDGIDAVRDKVDEVTKKDISKDEILQNQETNVSEQKSVFGAKPDTSSTPYPRPEVERRPETGSRELQSGFAFDGALPETINGRLAMVGIVWSFIAEKATGLTVFEQLFRQGAGLVYYLAVVQIITFAALIPFFNGESTDARSYGPFTAKAERWNGRVAMLAFLSLVLIENYIHAPGFGWIS